MSLAESPLLIVIEVLCVLALWALFLVLAGGAPRRPGRQAPVLLLRRVLDRERRTAVDLGWPLRWWIVLRAAVALAGLAAGVWLGTPLTTAGAFLLALLGLPYLVSGRADRRRMAREQALVEMVRSVTSLVRDSSQTLDAALTDVGAHPHPSLRAVVAPLARSQQSIRERLRQVDRLAMSPIANRICLDLLIAQSVTPEAFLQVATRVLLPQYERDLEIQRRNHAAASGARATVFVVVALMSVLLVVVMRTSALHHQYATPLGQIVLLMIAAMVAFVLFLVYRLTPRAEWVRWDLAEMDRILERRYA
ncbi:MAG: type II secretion system F family protein [Candidatus Dormibacteraceae bacterium]